MHYVYVIKSHRFNWIYIGNTSDLRKRFHQHNSGQDQSTKHYAPLALVYYEAYRSKSDAIKREHVLKTHGQQKEMLYKNISKSLDLAEPSRPTLSSFNG